MGKGPSADELRKTVTDRLIVALEAGTRPWIKPWICDPNAGSPMNVESKKRYRGVNPWLLDLTAMEMGYTNRHWGTFRQWKKQGGVARKGEKGSMIVFWKMFPNTRPNAAGVVDKNKKVFFLRYSKVFNYDQIMPIDEGIIKGGGHKLDKYKVDTTVLERFEHDEYEPAETLIADSGAEVIYGGERACYSPSSDKINCPKKERFPKLSEFYSAMFHELTHWCEKRTGFNKIEDKSYALAELVAEIGSCYVAEHIGVPVENPDDDQSAAYLAGWLSALKGDPKFIFTASKWASKAADILLDDAVEYDVEPTKEEPVADKQAA